MGALKTKAAAFVLGISLCFAVASAEDLTAASSRAIVERQLDAFARDDGDAAYALAAPTIKQMFGELRPLHGDGSRPLWRGLQASQRRVWRL